jgi:hypothetical protein
MKLRLLTALAVLVSAYVHLKLWFDGFRDLDKIGPAFMTNAIGGVVIAVLLVVWRRHWLPPLLAVGFGLSTLGAFIISATWGLFGLHESWVGWTVWTAAGAEVVAIIAGAVVLKATWGHVHDQGASSPERSALAGVRRPHRAH